MTTVITHTNRGRSPHKDNLVNLKGVPQVKSQRKLKEALKDTDTVFFHVTEDEIFTCTVLKFKTHNVIFPEPNPVSFYYSLAKDQVDNLANIKNILNQYYIDKSKLPPNLQDDIVIFSYIFKIASIGVIFSFLAIEALLNQLIPDDYTAIRKNKTIDKSDIQRYYTFDDKLTKLIPTITKKNFAQKYPKKYNMIKKLKDLRDELIHLKNNVEKSTTYYTKIYQNILDLNLKNIISATKNICNYYQRDIIIEK